MILTVVILLIIISISLHELGHATAMRKNRVEVSEINLLGFGKKLFSFRIRRLFGDTLFSVRLIPLGASVQPTDAQYRKSLKVWQVNHIAYAGIANNFLFASLLLSLSAVINQYTAGDYYMSGHYYVAMILFAMGIVPKYTSFLIVPLGWFILAFMVYYLVKEPAQFVENSGSLVTVAKDAADKTSSWADGLLYAASISFSIGLVNCLPLNPLDGSHIYSYYIDKYFSRHSDLIHVILAIPVVLLILIAIFGDLRTIYNFF